jgi:hypothetical protein
MQPLKNNVFKFVNIFFAAGLLLFAVLVQPATAQSQQRQKSLK